MATFAIISQQSNNGAISPLGTTNVTSGQEQDYTVTPATGYQIDSVWVDGVNQGAIPTYSFLDVLATHTIVALFTPASGYYCTQQDLINMVGMARLAQISNDVANATVPDPVIVMDKIAEAWNYLNAELDGTFTVPLAPTPGIVQDISVKVAIYNLFLRKFSIMQMPEEWATKYLEVVGDKNNPGQIERLKTGDLGLDDTLYPAISPMAEIKQHHRIHGIDMRNF